MQLVFRRLRLLRFTRSFMLRGRSRPNRFPFLADRNGRMTAAPDFAFHCRCGRRRAFTSLESEELAIHALARFASVLSQVCATDSSWLLRVLSLPIVSAHCAAVAGSVEATRCA